MTRLRKRVVITGMGQLSSLATNITDFKTALFALRCGIKPSERFRHHFADANASEVLAEIEYPGLSAELIAQLDKVALWAWKVGDEALSLAAINDAGLREKMGLTIGVSSAGTEAWLPLFEQQFAHFSLKKAQTCGSFFSVSAIISSLLGLKGGFEIVATACTASTNAMGIAYDQIQNGKNPAMLVIGTEPLYLPTFAGFYALKAMKRSPSSPFSGEPGMSIGEGAGALVLEEYQHAVARGATIYGEMLGYATSGDAHHETAPDPRAEGAVQVMFNALANATLQPEQIGYINAHGTGTEANDRCETLAMKKVFTNTQSLAVSSTKAYIGHNIGSAGILEFIACLLTLPEKKIPPTLNFDTPRPNCDLNYVPNNFIHADVQFFMKNNYAFGGNNCCIIASPRLAQMAASRYQPKRVAIVGMGAVSSLGHELSVILQKIRAGKCGGSRVPLMQNAEICEGFNTLVSNIVNAHPELAQLTSGPFSLEDIGNITDKSVWLHQIDDLNPRDYLRRFDDRKASNASTYALLALTQAMKSAGRKIRRDGEKLGMVLGMSKGPQTTVERYLNSLFPDPCKARTSEFPGSLMNAVSTFCSIAEGIKGYNTTLATGTNAALGALGYGYELVRQALQPQVIVGGADENLNKFVVYMQAMNQQWRLTDDPTDCQIYAQQGSGYLMGEGAAMLFLEDYDAARARGIPLLAELLGYGKANDCCYFDRSRLDERTQGLVSAIQQALDEAGITAAQVELICGTSDGTEDDTQIELDAIRQVFAARSRDIPLVNYTACFGVVESCYGILNMLVVLDMMRRGEILPVPWTKKFCADDIDFVTEVRQQSVNIALVLGASEGGNYYAFLLGKAE